MQWPIIYLYSPSPFQTMTSEPAEAVSLTNPPQMLLTRKSVKVWMVLMEVLVVIYGIGFMIYAAWPITLIAIDPNRWFALSFLIFCSLVKIFIPMFAVFMITLYLTYTDVFGALLGFCIASLLQSLATIGMLAYYMIIANGVNGSGSFANDPLYCCIYAGQVDACPSSYGPCGTFTGPLVLSLDSRVLLSFHVIFAVLEILAIVFSIQLYNALVVDQTKRLSWKRVKQLFVTRPKIGSLLVQSLKQGPAVAWDKVIENGYRVNHHMQHFIYGDAKLTVASPLRKKSD